MVRSSSQWSLTHADLHCCSRPVLTFAIILLLPSSLTLITLFIHRVRTARAARRDRAPEDIVKSLPSRVWTGTRVEKQDGVANDSSSGSGNAESNDDIPQPSNGGDASTSQAQPWHVLQSECAICLSDFVKGDTVRILPCHHIFHLDEVDAWLIHRKKLVSRVQCLIPTPNSNSLTLCITVSDLQSRCNAAPAEA